MAVAHSKHSRPNAECAIDVMEHMHAVYLHTHESNQVSREFRQYGEYHDNLSSPAVAR